jgi:hypothetical protein
VFLKEEKEKGGNFVKRERVRRSSNLGLVIWQNKHKDASNWCQIPTQPTSFFKLENGYLSQTPAKVGRLWLWLIGCQIPKPTC